MIEHLSKLVRGERLPPANEVRAAMHGFGGSVVVAVMSDILKIHVHTDTPEAEHRVNDRWRADIRPVLVRMHKGLDRLREDVRSERVAGVEQRRVAHRVPTLERRRATADAGELR